MFPSTSIVMQNLCYYIEYYEQMKIIVLKCTQCINLKRLLESKRKTYDLNLSTLHDFQDLTLHLSTR